MVCPNIGWLTLIIILERPKGIHARSYGVKFEKFVADCNTLWAVDELIRLAAKGARSIHTVTVLDAFSYKPSKNTSILDERCHQLLGQVLRIKKPKVILCCIARDTSILG
jgi:hypothetical protein